MKIKAYSVSILKKVLCGALSRLGYVCVSNKDASDFYLHEYESYEQYKEIQVFHNLRKIENVWADKETLNRVASLLTSRFSKRPILGLCHGTRNGFEQNYLRNLKVGIEATGTDISNTAADYENSVCWDFHDTRNDWIGVFDFVYTNSLDQSWKPKQALETWLGQLSDDGILVIEHTDLHGPKGASEMDPFGVRPSVMPYVLTMWFGSQISIAHSVAKKDNSNIDAWLFIVSKNSKDVVSYDS